MILDDGLGTSEHIEEDENYFISMTDMMVGVLFIFIIMLMLFALNFRQQTDISKEQLEDLRKKEQELRAVSAVALDVAEQLNDLTRKVNQELAAMDQANNVRSELLSALRTQLKAQGLDVEIDEKNGVLRLTENAIRFPVNHSDLDPDAKLNVDKVATALAAVLPRYTSCRQDMTGLVCEKSTRGASVETVFIEGHTDITGGDDKNWPLSTERAVTTYREMTTFAPDLRRLANGHRQEILSVSGYGSARTIDPDLTEMAHARNRRIDLRFVMEIESRQRLEELLVLTNGMQDELARLNKAVKDAQ